MSNHYVRLSNHPSDRHNREIDDEVQAAFDYREDDDDEHDSSESRPLNPNASRAGGATNDLPSIQPAPYSQQGTYNFDSVDYDFPPPGSPPPLSATAFPNDIGNSNGYIPAFDGRPVPTPHKPWWKRAASSVLPESLSDRLGWSSGRPTGIVGSGINNDGVFANVVAKPTAPIRVQNGDETYIVPEDAQDEAPPSYASAQADAVPPYWETTVHAPFAPDSIGELMVDSLPTGSLFSFCWNMLVSISFQFVGFLLTYLLHTSHAARLGSRAGLGVTLIQYGFALRGRLDSGDVTNNNGNSWTWATASDIPAQPAPTAYASMGSYDVQQGGGNSTMTEEQAALIADVTTEWLSFLLMTIGWFVLLTSFLGFYRVKRWERGILASQQATQQPRDVPAQTPGTNHFMNPFEQSFSLNGMSRIELLRQGLGIRRREDDVEATPVPAAPTVQAQAGDGQQPGHIHIRDGEIIVSPPLDPNDPRAPQIIRAMEQETRLRNSLRDAGFL